MRTLIFFLLIILSLASSWFSPLRAQEILVVSNASLNLQASGLSLAITAPDSLLYDLHLDTFAPNPFPFSVSVINRNDFAYDSVRAIISFPSDMQLDPSGQPLSKYFNPMKIEKWRPDLPVNQVDWTIRALRKPKSRKCDSIKVLVEAKNPAGGSDSTITLHVLCLPAVYPLLRDNIDSPDTLSLTSDRCHVTPNPFTVREIVKSIGESPAGIREVSAACTVCPGVRLMSDQGNPVPLDTVLFPGDSTVASFRFEIYEMSLVWRHVIIELFVIDEDGDALQNRALITIPAVDSVLFVEKTTLHPRVGSEIENFPNPFSDRTTIRLRMTNDELRMGVQSALRNPKSAISLKVYNLFGREVLDLTPAARAGTEVILSRDRLPAPGIYFYRLITPAGAWTKAMTAIR